MVSYDFLTPAERSQRMSRIRGKDTSPEMAVRRIVYSMGYRYRLHDGRLPGRPDMVFAGRRKVIFIHGCFWHLHAGCSRYRLPKANREFWMPKLEGNRRRDQRNLRALHEAGWDTLVIWECQTGSKEQLCALVRSFLESDDEVG